MNTYAWRTCLLIDEADSFIELKDEIRGILNAGHTRLTATVVRIGGDPPVPMMRQSLAHLASRS